MNWIGRCKMFKTKKSRALAAIIFGFVTYSLIVFVVGLFAGFENIEPGLISAITLTVFTWALIAVIANIVALMVGIMKWIEKGKADD